MKKRIVSMSMAFTLSFAMVGYFKIPKLPAVPNITNSITLPSVTIPSSFLEGIKLQVFKL
jgi:hypothetical protein